MSITFNISATTKTITRNPNYGTNWSSRRFNQNSIDTADGARVVYDNGPTVIEGEIFLAGVDKTEATDLLSFIQTTAIYGLNPIVITPPSNTNLGAGNGTAITAYYNGGQSLAGVFELRAPGIYNIRFPYRYLV